jgi:hypothetical protein
MNKYFIIAFLALLGIVSVQTCQLKKAGEKIDRISTNFEEVQQSNKNLSLSLKEFKGYMSERTDSILKTAKIKPKWVKEYTTIENHYYDTVKVEVPVEQVDTFDYRFLDKGECISVGGVVNIKDSIPKVTIDHREFTDSLDLIKYVKPNKWWFIRSGFLFGKDEKFEIHGNCGTYEYEKIKVIKE